MAKGDSVQARGAARPVGGGRGGACGSEGRPRGGPGAAWASHQVRSRYRGWKECERVTGQEAASCDSVG